MSHKPASGRTYTQLARQKYTQNNISLLKSWLLHHWHFIKWINTFAVHNHLTVTIMNVKFSCTCAMHILNISKARTESLIWTFVFRMNRYALLLSLRITLLLSVVFLHKHTEKRCRKYLPFANNLIY